MFLLYSGACLHIEEFNIDDRLSSISNSVPTIPVFVMKRARKLERNLYIAFFSTNSNVDDLVNRISRRTVPLKQPSTCSSFDILIKRGRSCLLLLLLILTDRNS